MLWSIVAGASNTSNVVYPNRSEMWRQLMQKTIFTSPYICLSAEVLLLAATYFLVITSKQLMSQATQHQVYDSVLIHRPLVGWEKLVTGPNIKHMVTGNKHCCPQAELDECWIRPFLGNSKWSMEKSFHRDTCNKDSTPSALSKTKDSST